MTEPPDEDRRIELEDLLVRPGTYFNPQTEVVVVVDDSVSIDQEVFDMEAYEGADWVRISDEIPVDADALDATMEDFQTGYHAGATEVSETTLEVDEGDVVIDEPDAPEPDPEEE
ncbi:MAG: hypothetical protein H0W09_03135 [Solirubrobacterales bacterium]|nr:hypothetical protein [Solirubrobacterales bacterium]